MNRALWILAICTFLAFTTGASAGGGKTNPNATSLKIWNSYGDSAGTTYASDIQTDAYGDFIDGVGGVKCFVDGNKFQLNLQKVSTPKRTLTYIAHPVDLSDCMDHLAGPGEGSTLKEAGYFNILDIAPMRLNALEQHRARFFTSVGAFVFGDFLPTQPEVTHCSTLVWVHRVNRTTWNVWADTGPAGEVAWFKTGLSDFAGNYQLAFRMTITCPACPCPAGDECP